MENTNKLRSLHLSFDLDGTLINSLPLYGLKIGWSQFKMQIGLPFVEICKNLGVEDLSEDLHRDYFNFNLENIEKIEAMPGLDVLLDWLLDNNIEWSIITSKPRVTALPILAKFSLSPLVALFCDDTQKGKPNIDPANLLKLKIQNGKEIYYIGDSIVDHIFSVNAGFKFIHFTPEVEEDYNLSASNSSSGLVLNPYLKVKSLSDIPNIL